MYRPSLPIAVAILIASALSAHAAPSPMARPPETATFSRLTTLSLRVHPGDDLKATLDRLCQAEAVDAGTILSAVGSLKQASLRFANQPTATVLAGPWEVVSLTGALSRKGSHVHLSVSDKTGRTLGGHLMPGNLVYTTLELVIGVLPDVVYDRQPDAETTYNELVIHKRPPTPADATP
jgi:predicted DNA-binding protein with PD1-like motif